VPPAAQRKAVSRTRLARSLTLKRARIQFVTTAEIRDVVQIAFFVVIAAVTVLTYFHAKRTILQPIRTEVFKQQLKLMSDILDFLTSDYDGEINDAFPTDQMVEINTLQMFDDYAETVLKIEVNRDERPYSPHQCRHGVIANQDMSVIVAGYHKPEPTDNESALLSWWEYRYEIVPIPDDLNAAVERLRGFARSPFAPKKLIELLLTLDRELTNRAIRLAEVLTECAKEMPEAYPTPEEFRASLSFLGVKSIQPSLGKS